MPDASIVFLINLNQDLNVVRPLVYLAARETTANIRFLLSAAFIKRDSAGIWREQIKLCAADVSGSVDVYGSAAEALMLLQGGRGAIIAGSESNLSAHSQVHEVFRVAPSGYLRITLQHGLECVGFLQNREHIKAHGRNVTFGADVVCTWLDGPDLTAMVGSQRSKLYVTGPQMLLQQARPGADHPPVVGGMVCENLHSVRLRSTGDHGKPFMDSFLAFSDQLAKQGEGLTLRPHPGGQYVLKNKVQLPENVILNNLPIYNVDLGAYKYGISAPSTVLIDMMLAGLPVGVWRDPSGIMDARIYQGLNTISQTQDWIDFHHMAIENREAILDQQQTFLKNLGMQIDAAEIYRRFSRLFVAATERRDPAPLTVATRPRPEKPRRVLFIAPNDVTTLQLSFSKPLQKIVDQGEMKLFYAFEKKMNTDLGPIPRPKPYAAWFAERFDEALPDIVVACRYSGPGAEAITALARERNIPVVYHIDDDLLNLPKAIGEVKYKTHMHPSRTGTVSHFLKTADMVYCSTTGLRRRFSEYGYRRPMVSGEIYCPGHIINRAENRPVTRVGLMGVDKVNDFKMVLPGLTEVLERNPQVEFEIFGSVPLPEELTVFGDRVRTVAPVSNYAMFLQTFASRRWDVGLAPLLSHDFNLVKANTKWVDYSSVGAAVIASAGTVYDICGADGCAMLVDETGWGPALQQLIDSPDKRYQQVLNAQTRLERSFTDDRLRGQIFKVFEMATKAQASSADLPVLSSAKV